MRSFTQPVITRGNIEVEPAFASGRAVAMTWEIAGWLGALSGSLTILGQRIGRSCLVKSCVLL